MKDYLMDLSADELISLMNEFAHHIDYDSVDVILPTGDDDIININCEFFSSNNPLFWKDEIHEIVEFALTKMSSERKQQLVEFIESKK